MAFSCKLPLSRRQFWEEETGLSQFNRKAFAPADKEKRQNSYDDSQHHQKAAVLTSKAHRRLSQPVELEEREKKKNNNYNRRSRSSGYYHRSDHSHGDNGHPGKILNRNEGLGASSVQIELTHTTVPSASRDRVDGPEAGHHRHQKDDSVVYPPAKINFSKIDVIFICLSIVLYIADIGLDCFVAYKHYLTIEEDPLYFIFTIAFILLAGVVTSIFSLWWYYFEYQLKKEGTPKDKPTRVGFIARVIACSLTLGPVVRYIDTIAYGLRSRMKGINSELRQYYHDEMQFQRADGAMLRLFEAFLESAPQFLLQVYIVLRRGLDGEREGNHFLVAITIASIASSVVSLSWSVVAYHKALRLSRHDVDNIEHFGLAFRFLWRFFEISPRITILAMFMSAFGFYLGIFAAIHFSVMVAWLYKLHTDFCEKPRCEIAFVTVMGLIWCFCFFNLKDGHTRRTSLVFYAIFFAENIGLSLAWLYKTQDEDIWFRHIVMPIVLGSMVPMTASMLIYYKFLHRKEIQTCLPWSYWNPCTHSTDVTATVSQPTDEWYNKGDGTRVERESLTHRRRSLPFVLTSEAGSVEADANVDAVPIDSTIPPYQAPSPASIRCKESADTSLAHAASGEVHCHEANLDDCVEVNGYLESTSLAKPASKLMRQDTIPKYIAPVPTCNYGATVPGGAPALYTLSVTKPTTDPSHGSTLPGAPSIATVVTNERFVPYDEEGHAPLPRRPLKSTKSTIDKPPVPEPRLSLHHEESINVSRASPCDDSNLTTVSELPNEESSMFDQTLSPSPVRPASRDRRSTDGNLLDVTPVCTKSHTRSKSVDAISGSSSLDTPMRPRTPLDGSLDLSIDTPVKDLLSSKTSKTA